MNWNNKKSPINIGYPLSPENLKKYQEGIDYKIEEIGGGFRKYHLLSEKIKADFRRFNGGEIEDIITEQQWFVPPSIPEELTQKIKEENEKHRQKFIAENNPPQTFMSFPTAEEDAWNQQQPPLTAAELAVLNDPILEYHGDWKEAVKWIMSVREANSSLFPDERFKWGWFLHKDMENPKSSMYKVNQAFKNAGISLDKWKERVARGQQLEAKRLSEKPQKDKEKILANIQDWEIKGEYIYNSKTGHWKSATYDIWMGGDDKEGRFNKYYDVRLTPETYSEIRKVIFDNLLKKIREDKVQEQYLKRKNGEEYRQSDFFPTEWNEISKLAQEKGINIHYTSQPHQSNPSNILGIIIGGGIILVSLILVGTLLLKVYKKNKKRR